MVVLSFLSSLLYVAMNAFSIWMISSLISTIMNPGENVNIIPMNNPGNSSYVLKLTNNPNFFATYTFKVDDMFYKNKYIFNLYGWGKDNSGNNRNKSRII